MPLKRWEWEALKGNQSVSCDRCGTSYSTVMRRPGERCGDLSLDPELLHPCLGWCRAEERRGAAPPIRAAIK